MTPSRVRNVLTMSCRMAQGPATARELIAAPCCTAREGQRRLGREAARHPATASIGPSFQNGDDAGVPSGIRNERAAFDVPADVAYFNTASLAPQLHAVRAAGEAALARRARPWTIAGDDWFTGVERLRVLFGVIAGANPEGVALIPATSYGFAVAARNLPLTAGQRVLVLDEEYPSGIYTWRAAARRAGASILTVTREPGQPWADAVLAAAADERVGIISVPNVHWTDGALVDLPAVAARARELGARLVIDASQSVGALPLDVAALEPDFLITVGYKWLLGPFGL